MAHDVDRRCWNEIGRCRRCGADVRRCEDGEACDVEAGELTERLMEHLMAGVDQDEGRGEQG